jgi:hypothetical protein
MITHGTPPAATQAGPNLLKISESAFWQGWCVALPANKWRTVCYHFATQLLNIGRDEVGCFGFSGAENPNKQGLFGTARYGNGLPFPNFETGALNYAATLVAHFRQVRTAIPFGVGLITTSFRYATTTRSQTEAGTIAVYPATESCKRPSLNSC